MVHVQMLSELEEVIQYKLVPERRESIKHMWWDRLQVLQPLQNNCFHVDNMKQLFQDIHIDSIMTFLRQINLFNKI